MRKLIVIVLLAGLVGLANAVTSSWTNSVGGDYTNAANWSAGVAGYTTGAVFSTVVGQNYTVDVTVASLTNAGIVFQPSSASPTTLTLNLHTNTITTTGFLNISGSAGTNTLIVNNGILVGELLTSVSAGYTTVLTITNATLNLSGYDYIGYSDTGGTNYVNVYAGGCLNSISTRIALEVFSIGNANLLIDGSNARVISISSIDVPAGYAGSTASVAIRNGLLQVGLINLGTDGANLHGLLTMTGGTNTVSGTIGIGGNGAGFTNTWGEYYMSGPNYPITTCGTLLMNGLAGTNNWAKLSVSNGFFHATGAADTVMNTVQPGSSAQVIVSGGNSTMQLDGITSVGGYQATSTVVIANGGTFEANTLTVAATTSSNTVYVVNNGGIYQYSSASPTLTPGTFGNISLTNGTISFRAITNADVQCNQSSGTLDSTAKLSFSGVNYFMLNNATNKAGTGQAYTFGTASGTATNWQALYMVNNQTGYRDNGAGTNLLTIDTTGAHICSNTTASVAMVYTNKGSLVIYNSGLSLSGNASIAGTTTMTLQSPVTVGGNLAVGGSLTVSGANATNGAVLFSCAGTRSGTFATTSVPGGLQVNYSSTQVTLGTSGGVTPTPDVFPFWLL